MNLGAQETTQLIRHSPRRTTQNHG